MRCASDGQVWSVGWLSKIAPRSKWQVPHWRFPLECKAMPCSVCVVTLQDHQGSYSFWCRWRVSECHFSVKLYSRLNNDVEQPYINGLHPWRSYCQCRLDGVTCPTCPTPQLVSDQTHDAKIWSTVTWPRTWHFFLELRHHSRKKCHVFWVMWHATAQDMAWAACTCRTDVSHRYLQL